MVLLFRNFTLALAVFLEPGLEFGQVGSGEGFLNAGPIWFGSNDAGDEAAQEVEFFQYIAGQGGGNQLMDMDEVLGGHVGMLCCS